jgi:hypothetical protein
VLIDLKLSWKPHIEEKIKMAKKALFAARIVFSVQFYYHQAGQAKPAGIAVSCAAAAASHLSQSYW